MHLRIPASDVIGDNLLVIRTVQKTKEIFAFFAVEDNCHPLAMHRSCVANRKVSTTKWTRSPAAFKTSMRRYWSVEICKFNEESMNKAF